MLWTSVRQALTTTFNSYFIGYTSIYHGWWHVYIWFFFFFWRNVYIWFEPWTWTMWNQTNRVQIHNFFSAKLVVMCVHIIDVLYRHTVCVSSWLFGRLHLRPSQSMTRGLMSPSSCSHQLTSWSHMTAASNTPLPRRHKNIRPPSSGSPPPPALSLPPSLHLTPHGYSPSTRTPSSSLTLDPTPTLTPQSQTQTALRHSYRAPPISSVRLHGGGQRHRLQRPYAGGVRHWRHRAGRIRARAPPRGARVPSVPAAARRGQAPAPPPPPPRARLHGRLLRHDALRTLQRAAPGARPRGRAHRRRHQRRRDQGKQRAACYAPPREVLSQPSISHHAIISFNLWCNSSIRLRDTGF